MYGAAWEQIRLHMSIKHRHDSGALRFGKPIFLLYTSKNVLAASHDLSSERDYFTTFSLKNKGQKPRLQVYSDILVAETEPKPNL